MIRNWTKMCFLKYGSTIYVGGIDKKHHQVSKLRTQGHAILQTSSVLCNKYLESEQLWAGEEFWKVYRWQDILSLELIVFPFAASWVV